jgi:hypothetical protein
MASRPEQFWETLSPLPMGSEGINPIVIGMCYTSAPVYVSKTCCLEHRNTFTYIFITNLISKVLCETIPQYKSLKLFKTLGKKLKFTCFGQYGHHQVLKCFAAETVAFAVAALIYLPGCARML